MTNEEYIKSLEGRIETLEKVISMIQFDEKQGIIFNGCEISTVVFEKCKEITFEHNEMETGAFVGFIQNVTNSTIHNFATGNSKSTLKRCAIHNYSDVGV